MNKKEYLEIVEKNGLKTIDTLPENPTAKEKYGFIDKNGYKYYLSLDSIKDSRTKKYRIASKYNKYSIENIQNYIYKNGGKAKVLSTEYINEKTKLKLQCEKCHKIYHICWNHIQINKKFYCNSCGRDRGYDEELKVHSEKLCKKHGYTIIDDTYVSRRQFDMIDKQGYKYSNCNIVNLDIRTNKFRRFDCKNKYQIENMKLYLRLNNIPTNILNKNNVKTKSEYLTVVCTECGEVFQIYWQRLKDCGAIVRCHRCKKKQSNLEYMVEQYLIEKNFIYVKEKKFGKLRNKRCLRFDFYLEDYNTVIEVNGAQHYYENENFAMSLQEQKERDKIKREFCENNGIKYVAIPFWLISQNKPESYKKIIDNIAN